LALLANQRFIVCHRPREANGGGEGGYCQTLVIVKLKALAAAFAGQRHIVVCDQPLPFF
jgi:hypothetical protein